MNLADDQAAMKRRLRTESNPYVAPRRRNPRDYKTVVEKEVAAEVDHTVEIRASNKAMSKRYADRIAKERAYEIRRAAEVERKKVADAKKKRTKALVGIMAGLKKLQRDIDTFRMSPPKLTREQRKALDRECLIESATLDIAREEFKAACRERLITATEYATEWVMLGRLLDDKDAE